jgi:hypothetical protein
MIQLAEKLKAIGLSMPPKIVFQFDNCRENKVTFCVNNLFLNCSDQFVEQRNVHIFEYAC